MEKNVFKTVILKQKIIILNEKINMEENIIPIISTSSEKKYWKNTKKLQKTYVLV